MRASPILIVLSQKHLYLAGLRALQMPPSVKRALLRAHNGTTAMAWTPVLFPRRPNPTAWFDPKPSSNETESISPSIFTQLDPIYVVANVSSQQALQIRANLDQRRLTLAELQRVPIEAALSNETGFPHRGTIEYVSPAIDQATGTLLVRGIMRNLNRTLLPGMFVNVRLPMGKTLQSALLVPDRALQEDQGGRYLLVLDQGDVIRQRYVQTGEQSGGLRVITSGLKPDDRVVVGELWRATPGTKVVPQLTSMPG